MNTSTEVVNGALLRAKSTKFITDLDSEDTDQANALRIIYEQARRSLLDYPCQWNFAKRRFALVQLAETPPDAWAYVYAIPDDLIRAWEVPPAGMRSYRRDQIIPFELGNNGVRKVLYCDQPNAELVYTADVSSVNLFSPRFTEALMWRVALDYVLSTSNNSTLLSTAERWFAVAIGSAMASNHNERGMEAEPLPDTAAARQ